MLTYHWGAKLPNVLRILVGLVRLQKECERLGGICRSSTPREHEFLSKSAPDVHLYLGAEADGSEEKPSTDLIRVDGSKVEPEYGAGLKSSFARTFHAVFVLFKGGWHVHKYDSAFAAGYICEWPGELD